MNRKVLLLLLALVVLMMGTACSGGKEEGIISAQEWEKDHPDIYASYLKNNEMAATTYGGSEQIDYLEKYPYLNTLYDGNSFSIEYLRARGHTYALEDVVNSERPKPAASCLTCKTSGFLTILEAQGVAGNALKFEEVVNLEEMETINCYDCHKNEPGVLYVTREHLNVAIEGIGKEFKPEEMACAQCHVEYYLDPETKAVIMPSVNGLNPEAMMAYYDDLGYSDWTHPVSGTPLLKVQHPEWETFQGSLHQGYGFTCVNCHMPDVESASGDVMPSHQWTSPLKNVEASCLTCHTKETSESMTAKVEGLQGRVEERMNETALKIEALIQALGEAQKSGVSEAVLTEARAKHRAAQWYWDFVFVENSEGFHNNPLSHKLLDQAEQLTEEALTLLQGN